MTAYRAAWVCPVDAPPIADGWVRVEQGRIAAVGRPGEPAPSPVTDLGRVALMPGLVNAHVHLELSWLRGRVPPADSFIKWITQLFALRRSPESTTDPAVRAAALDAARDAVACGTVAVGDISNSLAAVGPMAEAGLEGLVFHELIGFKERDGRLVEQSRAIREAVDVAGARISVAPHAPYSVSAELFAAIRAEVDRSAVPITSVHLAESPEEVEMLGRGTGAWPSMLKAVGAWRDDWVAPGTDPASYVDGLGVIDERTLVVHAVQCDARALERLAARRATVVTCPRSNQWVGVGVPPVPAFFASGVAVAIGTDSLASVEDLNLFSELKTLRWLAPEVPARRLIESATLAGARALGLGDELGTLTPGKRARLITVALPAMVDDIEEYLVGGIEPRQVTHL